MSRVLLKPMQEEAEGYLMGRRYSLLSYENMSWVSPGNSCCELLRTLRESYFSTVISTKKLPTKKLENFKSPLLTFTPDEESDCYKYCFQTRLTKETVNERIRSSLGMWSIAETYIDNDIQLVLDRIHTYYK
jgi:hypothetical protein